MIRFKVIKGSHLMLAISAILLAMVIVFILLQGGIVNAGKNAALHSNDILITGEAGAIQALASQTLSTDLKIDIIKNENQVFTDEEKYSVLIYHTHTHEAYEPDPENPYISTEDWRTSDPQHSIVRVGDALAKELEKLGWQVVHDTTDHELDDMSKAYVRSLKTLEAYEQEFDLCIDLHRDAYVEGMPYFIEDDQGTSYAQIMPVVGCGNSYTGIEKPDYEQNLAFAQQLSSRLNRCIPNLSKNVNIRNERFNQHIGKHSLLIEIGHNRNLLQHALNSVIPLADCLNSTMLHFD